MSPLLDLKQFEIRNLVLFLFSLQAPGQSVHGFGWITITWPIFSVQFYVPDSLVVATKSMDPVPEVLVIDSHYFCYFCFFILPQYEQYLNSFLSHSQGYLCIKIASNTMAISFGKSKLVTHSHVYHIKTQVISNVFCQEFRQNGKYR